MTPSTETRRSKTVEINQLYKRIHQLEELLHQKQASVSSVNDRIQAQYAAETKAIADGYIESFRNFEASCSATFKKNTERIQNAYKSKVRMLEQQYEALMKETEAVEDKLQREYGRLEKRLSEIEKKQDNCSHIYRSRALSSIHSLKSNIESTEKRLPVSFFFPRKMDIYNTELMRAQELFDKQFYDLSESASSCADLGVKRLENDTVREMESFFKMLERYSQYLNVVAQYISSEEVHTNGQLTMTDPDLGFWSDGLFDVLKDEIDQHRSYISTIRDQCTSNNLSIGNKHELKDYIDEQIENVKSLPDIIRLTCEYAFNTYMTSNQMDIYMQKFKEYMATQNFILDSDMYDRCSAPMTRSFWIYLKDHLSNLRCIDDREIPDLRETRRLVFKRYYSEFSEQDMFIVTLIPHRSGLDKVYRTVYELRGSCKEDDAVAKLLQVKLSTLHPTRIYNSEIPPTDPQKLLTRKEVAFLVAAKSN